MTLFLSALPSAFGWFGGFELFRLHERQVGVRLRVLREARVEASHLFKLSLILFEVFGLAALVFVRVDPRLQARDFCSVLLVVELFRKDRCAFGRVVVRGRRLWLA